MNKKKIKADSNKSEELLKKARVLMQTSYKKYRKSRKVFVRLSLTSLFISALSIILNLYAIRFNSFPVELMGLFVSISVIGVLSSFIITIQSFFSFSNEKHKLNENIQTNLETIRKIEEKEPMSLEELDKRLESL